MGTVVVKISDMGVVCPPDTLITYALGSCVGICLYDAKANVAGLAHIMLPEQAGMPEDSNLLKYADTAIPQLVRAMEGRGAQKERLVAKIAGGARMFGMAREFEEIWNIGSRNVRAVQDTLRRMSIPLVAQDVLEDYGRTVEFSPATGVMTVRTLKRMHKTL